MKGSGRGYPMSPETLAKIKRLKAEGLTLVAIAERLGLNKRSVQQALSKASKP